MKAAIFAAALSAASASYAPYNVVQLLANNPFESTLVTAVVAADLATALSGKGPFTIFAPTDRAFEQLPPGVLPDLLKNVTALTEILTYHVVAGNVSSGQLTNNEQVPTLFKGHSINVEIHPGPRPGEPAVVTLDRYSQVIYANSFGTNGVYHTIDRVLVPRAADMSEGLRAIFAAAEARAEEALIAKPALSAGAFNLVQRLALIPEYSTLVTAVTVGGLAGALSGPGPFTLFAPDDFAFERLPPGVLARLLKNVTELDEVLTYHVAKGNVSSSDLTDGEQIPTLNGKDILVNLYNETRPEPHTVVILDHHVLVALPNNYASNGVFHGVDDVLLPPRLAEKYSA